jgi:hypothetical protein
VFGLEHEPEHCAANHFEATNGVTGRSSSLNNFFKKAGAALGLRRYTGVRELIFGSTLAQAQVEGLRAGERLEAEA